MQRWKMTSNASQMVLFVLNRKGTKWNRKNRKGVKTAGNKTKLMYRRCEKTVLFCLETAHSTAAGRLCVILLMENNKDR